MAQMADYSFSNYSYSHHSVYSYNKGFTVIFEGPDTALLRVVGTPVSSTRKLISSSSFHRLDMTLAIAEALNPSKPNQIIYLIVVYFRTEIIHIAPVGGGGGSLDL